MAPRAADVDPALDLLPRVGRDVGHGGGGAPPGAPRGPGRTPSLPQPRVVGGLGDTPGFDYRQHLESVISHGTPPIKWVKRILFGS